MSVQLAKHCISTCLIGSILVYKYIQALVQAHMLGTEEQLFRDPNNVVRCCVLDTKYVGTMDFDLEAGDKEYLYKLGKTVSRKWIDERVATIKGAKRATSILKNVTRTGLLPKRE